MAATKKAPAKKAAAPKKSAAEVSKASGRPSGTRINNVPSGASGLKRSFGYVQEEFLTELTGARAANIWNEMGDNDPTVGAMFFGIEMFLRRVKWFVDPFDESEKGEADAKFLRECKEDMSHTWSDFIAEVMSMMRHGWSWFEILYKMRSNEVPEGSEEPISKFDDGKIGWRKFEIRSQDSLDKWDFDDEGGIRGMYQRPAPDYTEKYVSIYKSLLFRTTSRKNNPEGRSVLRNAYRPYYFKKRIEEIEGIGIERDLAGLPFAEVPAEMMRSDASEADKETLASIVELVKNVRRDEQEGVIWPQVWDPETKMGQYQFKLLASSGTRQFNTSEIIGRYDSRIAMTVIADFLLLGQDSSGSFAMSTNKSGLFQSALSVWLDVIMDVLNNYAIPRLFRLNGDFSGNYPRFRHDEVQKPSLADLATFVAALTGAGAQLFPDVDLENHFREMMQLPLREAKDEDKAKEDELRQVKVDSSIENAKLGVEGAKQAALGKQPGSVPGAPTKTTGKVKSKLPPQQRRRTAAVDAAENVAKRRVVRRKRASRSRVSSRAR
jgi:hypothetical protein